jgi:hypothetical protein
VIGHERGLRSSKMMAPSIIARRSRARAGRMRAGRLARPPLDDGAAGPYP